MKIYDFETVISRSGTGSMKWNEMRPYHCGDEIIPFSVADMELKTMPEIVEGLKDFLDNCTLGYSNPSDAYKSAVCHWMKRHHNWDISPDWIVDTPGVIHAFFNAIHAFTKPGDGVLLTTPVYYPMYMGCERNGRQIVASPLINENGVYKIDFDDFEQKARQEHVKLFILCSPHNPSSRVWTKDELLRLGKICLENNVLICSDEIHNDLIMPGYTHTVFATLGEEFAQNCMVCTAPSKTFNLAGMQTSNIIIPNPALRDRFCTEMRKHDGNPKCNILGLEACRLAYTHGDDWHKQVISLIDANRKLVVDFLAKEYPAVRVTPMEGTYLLWMDFRPLGIEAKKLAQSLREDGKLFFDDGFIFGEQGTGFERWNLACPTAYIQAALQRLKNTLDQHL